MKAVISPLRGANSQKGRMTMATAFIRTIVLYFLIMVGLRLLGKRQIGELEPIELVLTLLISDLAAVPMQDFGIPLLNGVIPIVTLLSALDAALVGERALHPPAAADLRQPDGAHFRWQGAAGRNAPQPLHARRAHRGTPLSGRDGPHKRQIRGARNGRAALCPPLSRRAARNA